MYGMQYHLQYAGGGSPMLNTVLGIHKPGSGSGSPVMEMQGGGLGGSAPQGYYLTAAPYPGDRLVNRFTAP